MKHIQTYKLFERKKITGNSQRLLSKIYLFEIIKDVYVVEIKDRWVRSLVFMRFQEYYESGSELFNRKDFEVEDFMKWYQKDFKKSDLFSYGDDWSGFNIPSDILEKCASDIKNPNSYDKIIFSIIDAIHKNGSKKYYLIGTDTGADQILLKHEIAHALYYSNLDYKQKIDNLINSIPDTTIERFEFYIKKMGYGDNVVNDEIQANLTTGDINEIEDDLDIKIEYLKYKGDFKELQKPFIEIFEQEFRKIYSDPYFIRVDYSKYF